MVLDTDRRVLALGLARMADALGNSFLVIANVLLQVPFGRWSDRLGRRPFLLGGFVLLVPSLVVRGYAPELAAGLGPIAGDLARAGQSGTTLSVLTTAFGFGVALGPLASGFLVRYGFVVPFLFAAALAALAFALTYVEVEESLGTVIEEPPGEPAPQDDY